MYVRQTFTELYTSFTLRKTYNKNFFYFEFLRLTSFLIISLTNLYDEYIVRKKWQNKKKQLSL